LNLTRVLRYIAWMEVKTNLDSVLKSKQTSLYRLQKLTGVSYNTLHRLKTGTSQGITFDVLNRICTALDCLPGELLIQVKTRKKKP
jgi:putative transcriptional regulator